MAGGRTRHHRLVDLVEEGYDAALRGRIVALPGHICRREVQAWTLRRVLPEWTAGDGKRLDILQNEISDKNGIAVICIETNRFELREYRPSGENAFVAYQTNPDFAVFHTQGELGEDHARQVFRRFLAWQTQHPRLNYQLAIISRRNEAGLIGSCGVRMEGCNAGEAVFGVELARPFWGRYAYAAEVATAMIAWAFSNLPLQALIADTATANDAVARLAEAAGFRRTQTTDKQWWRLDRRDWKHAFSDSVE